MTKTMTAESVQKNLQSHLSSISPGQPFRLTSSHSIGDGVWQGDLGISIVSKVPSDYVEIMNPQDVDRQLVPESGQGSHHRLKSLIGVRIFHPKDWGVSPTNLRGPFIILTFPNEIVHEPGHDHPHGTIFIDEPMIIECRYQRNWSKEQRERRTLD